jgi:hypothetical protein
LLQFGATITGLLARDYHDNYFSRATLFGKIAGERLPNNSTDVNQLLHQKRIDDAREEERLLEPNLWHSLLNREPTVLRGPKQVSLHYQRDRMELALASFRPAFVPLGQTEAPRYEIAVRVEQTPWVGNFGFFFGYGDNPKENEIAYQVVQLLSQRLGREEPQLKVIWTSTTAVRNHGSREEMTVTKHLSRPFPGLLGEHRLAVTVGPHGVETVFVDQLLVVTIPAAKSSPLPARTRRRFGIYIANGSVVFRDAQYRYFKEP